MTRSRIIKLGGKIILDDLSHLDQSLAPSLLLDDLKEDLFQAIFPLDQLIDIGWYPEFCEDGYFRVVLISKHDWTNPVHTENAKNWKELEKSIVNTLKKVRI